MPTQTIITSAETDHYVEWVMRRWGLTREQAAIVWNFRRRWENDRYFDAIGAFQLENGQRDETSGYWSHNNAVRYRDVLGELRREFPLP